jgi:hypothetical protein
MSQDIRESDWKIFRELHGIALERYFDRAVADIEKTLATDGKTSREQFWDVANLAHQRKKEVANLFDDFRRSTALMQLGIICATGLLTDEEILRFSPEAQESVQRFLTFARR